MNETITYAGVVWLIVGFTIGRIIGIMFINRLEKRRGK